MLVKNYNKLPVRKDNKPYVSQLKNFHNNKHILLNKFKYNYRKHRKLNRRYRKVNKKFVRNFSIFLKLNNLLHNNDLKDGVLLEDKNRSYKRFIIRSLRLNIKRNLLINKFNSFNKFRRRYLKLVNNSKFSRFNLLLKRQLLRQKKVNKFKLLTSLDFISQTLNKNFKLLYSFFQSFKHHSKHSTIKKEIKAFNKFYYVRPFFKKRESVKLNKNFRSTQFHLNRKNRLNPFFHLSKKYDMRNSLDLLKFNNMSLSWYNKLRNFKTKTNLFNHHLSPFYNRIKFIRNVSSNNATIEYFYKINRKFNRQVNRLNRSFYNNYNPFYLSFIDNSISYSLTSNIAKRYALTKFTYNKRRTKFLKYKGVYLGRSKYRIFNLIKNNLLLIKNRENNISKNYSPLSYFYYNNLLNFNKIYNSPQYTDIRGKYVQRKAGHWWRMPWHRQKKWWKLKGKLNLTLFNKSFVKLRRSRARFNKKKVSFTNLRNSKKILKVVLRQATNNYFINVMRGDKSLFMVTAGMVGFKGPKRRSWFAAQQLSKQVAYKILKRGSKMVDLEIRSEILSKHSNEVLKGLLKATARALKKGKKSVKTKYILRSLRVNSLTTVYSRSHNGLRKRKSRRL